MFMLATQTHTGQELFEGCPWIKLEKTDDGRLVLSINLEHVLTDGDEIEQLAELLETDNVMQELGILCVLPAGPNAIALEVVWEEPSYPWQSPFMRKLKATAAETLDRDDFNQREHALGEILGRDTVQYQDITARITALLVARAPRNLRQFVREQRYSWWSTDCA